MSTVVVVSNGGTIAMRPDPASGKLVLSGAELVEMLDWPEAPPLARTLACAAWVEDALGGHQNRASL